MAVCPEVTIISVEARSRPDLRFVWSHAAHAIALGGGIGLVPKAPGTAGTLLAFPLYWVVAAHSPWHVLLLLIAAAFVLGVWACAAAGSALGAPDHGAIVWDEIVAFMLVLMFTPAAWSWQVYAFALFRLFDIIKPPPIRYFDRKWKNGFGVMFDDLLAALYVLVVLKLTHMLVNG